MFYKGYVNANAVHNTSKCLQEMKHLGYLVNKQYDLTVFYGV